MHRASLQLPPHHTADDGQRDDRDEEPQDRIAIANAFAAGRAIRFAKDRVRAAKRAAFVGVEEAAEEVEHCLLTKASRV